MFCGGPYRSWPPHPGGEEDLWLRLDEALGAAFRDPVWAWGVAWGVARDAAGFPDVRRAASALMEILYPLSDVA